MAIKSFGITVIIGGTEIAELQDVQISGRDVTNIDTTAHDTEDGARTFIGGLIDNGTLEITANYSASSSFATIDGYAGLNKSVIINFSDSSSVSFNVVVGAPNIDNPLDDKPTWSCSSKITGPISA